MLTLLSLSLILACDDPAPPSPSTAPADVSGTAPPPAAPISASTAVLGGLSVQRGGQSITPAGAMFVYSPQLDAETMKLHLYREATDCSRAPLAAADLIVSGIPRAVGGAATVGSGAVVQIYAGDESLLAFSGFTGQVTVTALDAQTATATLDLQHGDGHSASGTLTAPLCEITY